MSKNLPQSYSEMVADGQEKKNNRLYRAESSDYIDGKLTELVNLKAAELAEVADTKRKVRLSDLEAVQERTILYIKSAAETATIPTFSGLARSCGLSTEALNLHMRKYPNDPVTEWLQIVHDQFADTLAEAAMKNLVNSIVSIFSLKARSGWKDSVVIETPVQQSPLGPEVDAEAICEKYRYLVDNE